MRKLAWLGVCALGLLLAVPAFADVRPAPLRVEWVGPLPDLQAGTPFTGTFRFVSSTPVEITNVRLSGAGWNAALTSGNPRLQFAAAGTQQVQFQATAADPSQPLVLEWSANGVPMVETVDFAAAAAAQPGATRSVAVTGEARGAAQLNTPGPITAFDQLQVRRPEDFAVQKPVEPTGVQQVTARNIRVHGRFVYYRSDATTIGADGLTVRIKDGGSQLAQVATDAYGYYDVTFYWNPCAIFCHSNPDLNVEFDCANTKVNVRTTGIFGGTYTWSSGTWSGYTGSDLDVGWLTPTDETQHPALEIITDITRDWRWYLNYQGYNQNPVTMFWPDGASGAYYSGGEIHVGMDRSWREDTHAHEYGHHWIATWGASLSPAYCNGICDSPSGCGHCMWCQETDHDAWAEGWPNWICHVQTVSYATDYGIAALNVRDAETVQVCSTTLDDPTLTEGFIGAFMQDLWDSANEDDPNAPGTWRDVLSLGTDEIFTVADLDGPTTATGFIIAFKNRYPWLHEQIWETAKNNTFEMDVNPPSVVTGLTSPSHATFTSSPDPTVDFTWTRADDDWSGPSGYSVVISGGPTLPAAVQNIGDVTSWTSGTLSPGTYYMSIRTRDRAGRWSASYSWYGPFTIRVAEPANLTSFLPGGWSRPVVPHPAADVTSGVPDPGPLTGDASATWWNLAGINNGESTTSSGFESRCYIDDVWKYWASWGPIGAGGWFYGINLGPMYAYAGRHTFETRYDATELISETNENDNRWGHQWSWIPPTMTPAVNVARAAPPIRSAGWPSIVDGSPIYSNVDGVRMYTVQPLHWWHAVYAVPTDLSADYDVYLYNPTVDASNGFTSSLASSGALAGYLDAVFVNRNTVGSPTSFDVGVLNYSGSSTSYTARQVMSDEMTFGDSVNVSMGTGEMMLLREFYLGTSDVGAVSITAKIISGTGPVHLQWRDASYTTGSLYSYGAGSVADGATTARLDLNIATTGWEGICLYRDPKDGNAPVTLVLEISKTPPDFTPYWAGGWHAPFVPRPAADGTVGSVPLPDTLYGNASSTYLNLAVTNNSPTGADGLLGQVFLDGVYTWWLAYGFFPGYTVIPFNWGAAWNVRGGRHTLSVYYDAVQAIEEKYEDNNIYGEQYIWSPYLMSPSVPVTRGAPPDKVGGWSQVTSGEPLYYNCDGLRMPAMPYSGADNFWGAVAVMPGASSDVDVRLHELQPGTKNGFGPVNTISDWGISHLDFCLVNFNLTSPRAFDAGMINFSGVEPYVTEVVGSKYLASYPNSTYGPFSINSGHLLNLHEVYLGAGTYAIAAINASGSVDWGLSVHPWDQVYQNKSTVVPGGLAWLSPPGQDEMMTLSIPAAGYYCVAVWKVGAADLPQAGSYKLQIRSLTADSPGLEAAATALTGVSPNPATSGTRVSFALARPGHVRLEVYDLHGARVRTLADGESGAGRFDLRWEGDDDAGHAVAPGVYFVRFASQGVSGVKRLVKME
jgi:hypothetical protein